MRLILSIVLISIQSFAAEAPKGVLPEIALKASDEDNNQKKALSAEILISKTEEEAIRSLEKIIQKHHGSPDEASLYNRLAELYMRRAKSGRFFDLFRDNEKLKQAVSFIAPQIREQTAARHLRDAIKIYDRMQKQWPNFEELDSVIFNDAFANQQLGQNETAERHYQSLIKMFPTSPLVPDAHLALGEMAYDKHSFATALIHFQAIEEYPQNRVYSYGLYKEAWTLYNMHDAEGATSKLLKVIAYFSEANTQKINTQHNLRAEALRDLSLFFEETKDAKDAYAFFSPICEKNELEETLVTLAKLYDSHSRYKDLEILASAIVLQKPTSMGRVNIELMLTNALELQKNREAVITHLRSLNRLCSPDSSFRKQQPASASFCEQEVARITTEMAKKWWDLWQKNKSHEEVARWTEQAFEMRLASENPQKPDVKVRFAYAELLFQLGRFKEASANYEKSSEQFADTALIQQSSFSALVAAEKAQSPQDEILRLSLKYLKLNNSGEHLFEVQFKVGFIYYSSKNTVEAEKWLRPLSQSQAAGTYRRQAQDLILDILNGKKDYAGLVSYSETLLKENNEPERKAHLEKIHEESEYAQLQIGIEKNPNAAATLKTFSEKHANSDLATKALWQAVSLQNARGNSIDAAELCLNYTQKFPSDAKNAECLQTAAATYADAGLLTQSALTLLLLAEQAKQHQNAALHEKSILAAADVYAIDGQGSRSRDLLMGLFNSTSDRTKMSAYAKKILESFENKKSAEYRKYESQFAAKGFEPYVSLIAVEQSEHLLDQEKWSDAFNSTKNLVSGNVPNEAKAKANMVRAQVFEHELISQSVKTNVDRLATVLAIKTEKMDKAQATYTLAGKLSEDAKLQLDALLGLQRCYENFIESVGHPIIKTDLSENERLALDKELKKMLDPIQARAKEIADKISIAKAVLAKNKNADTGTTLRSAASATLISRPLPLRLNASAQGTDNKFELRKSDKCQTPNLEGTLTVAQKLDLLTDAANRCVALKTLDQAESIAETMSRLSPQTVHGVFYLAVVAQARSQDTKAHYLFQLAAKKDPKNPIIASYGGGQ